MITAIVLQNNPEQPSPASDTMRSLFNRFGIEEVKRLPTSVDDWKQAFAKPSDSQMDILLVEAAALLDEELLEFLLGARADATVLSLPPADDLLQHAGNGPSSMSPDTRRIALMRGEKASEFRQALLVSPETHVFDVVRTIAADHAARHSDTTDHASPGEPHVKGGSYARSNVVTRFRKEARNLGRRKLRDEIRFLRHLPADLASLYPAVILHGDTEELVFMEEEFLPLKTLRQHFFADDVGLDGATRRLETILGAIHAKAYAPHKQQAPQDYLDQIHFQRAWHRLRRTLERAPVFAKIVDARRLWINGKEYRNVPELLAKFEQSQKARAQVGPAFVSAYIHGDLHFENIMVDPNGESFRLVDPRGYDSCDIYYDLGKVSHSVNGKYDFIHQSLFTLHWSAAAGEVIMQFSYEPSPVLDLFNSLDRWARDYYVALTGDPLAEIRTLFAEAIHFCTMMPFHLVGEGRESKAILLYATGVMLLNELCAQLDIPELRNDAPLGNRPVFEKEWRNVG